MSDLIAEGASSFVSSLFGAHEATRPTKRDQARWATQRGAVRTALQKGLAAVGRQLQLTDTTKQELLRAFLASPEAEAIVRHVLSSESTPATENRKVLPKVREEFFAAAERFVGTTLDEVLLARIFESIVEASRLTYADIKNIGLISSEPGVSNAHSRAVARELAGVETALRALRNRTAPLSEILEFEQLYRGQAAAAHATLVPPHLDRATPIPIEQLFVPPALSTSTSKDDLVSLNDLTETIGRSVVLGNPGGGKSTLAQHICHRLATSTDRVVAGRRLTPILVVLREYGSEVRNRPLSIVAFIENQMSARYQLQPPHGAIDYLLASGRALVIFDGLDELIETSFRRDVVAAVQLFCNRYAASPVLVTSRVVGYEQAPLDPRQFTTLYLASFDDQRVRQYAEQWFALDDQLTATQKRSRTEAFLRESQTVDDLRTNPLMLGLLCNIYRGENHIPQNRPDVYRKCAVMLFERWDEGRGIKFELSFRSQVRPALTAIAHWIYSDPGLQAGVKQTQLVARTARYLLARRFEHPEEALEAATNFVEFCRGRAWVFTDTGTTPDGEPIYQFTHRTFMEFFTAEHIVRSVETTEQMYQELRDRIARQEWDMVSQLAFQLRNRASEEAADYLLHRLAEEMTEHESDATWNLATFAARCLEFMVPAPRVTRKLVEAVFRRALRRRNDLRNVFGILYRVSPENRAIVIDELVTVLRTMMHVADDTAARNAAWALIALDADTINLPSVRNVVLVAQRNLLQSDNVWEQLAATDESLATAMLSRRFARPSQAIAWHGLGVIYKDASNDFVPGIAYNSFAVTVLADSGAESALADLGRTVISNPGQRIEERAAREAMRQQLRSNSDMATLERLSPDAMFGLFCLYAPLAEIADAGWALMLDTHLPRAVTSLLQDGTDPTRANLSTFHDEQLDLISRWRDHRHRFVVGRV